MKKIQFDSGVQEYRLGSGGVLRFNPGDPNVYARFQEAIGKLENLEQSLQQQQGDALELLTRADREIKNILGWVFGGDNDMDAALGGINLLAVATNGERVVTNLLGALQPILVEGAQRCIREKTEAAVAKANARRQNR